MNRVLLRRTGGKRAVRMAAATHLPVAVPENRPSTATDVTRPLTPSMVTETRMTPGTRCFRKHFLTMSLTRRMDGRRQAGVNLSTDCGDVPTARVDGRGRGAVTVGSCLLRCCWPWPATTGRARLTSAAVLADVGAQHDATAAKKTANASPWAVLFVFRFIENLPLNRRARGLGQRPATASPAHTPSRTGSRKPV